MQSLLTGAERGRCGRDDGLESRPQGQGQGGPALPDRAGIVGPQPTGDLSGRPRRPAPIYGRDLTGPGGRLVSTLFRPGGPRLLLRAAWHYAIRGTLRRSATES